MNDDRGQQWQARFQLLPNPLRQSLAGGVLQSWHVVQIVVIQLIEQWLESCLDVGKIHDPALGFYQLPADMNFDAK